MATLYEIQPDDLEPIEFTHFDCWFIDEEEENSADLNLRANEILDVWEKTLDIKFERDGMDFNCWVAVQDLFDDIVDQIVKSGYSVYRGDSFIEIYSKADSDTKKYSVIKVVGYAYTVEASSREEAEQIVEEYGSVEADDIYTDSIDATLIRD